MAEKRTFDVNIIGNVERIQSWLEWLIEKDTNNVLNRSVQDDRGKFCFEFKTSEGRVEVGLEVSKAYVHRPRTEEPDMIMFFTTSPEEKLDYDYRYSPRAICVMDLESKEVEKKVVLALASPPEILSDELKHKLYMCRWLELVRMLLYNKSVVFVE